MHLLIRRSERDDGWFSSSIVFTLDALLELTPEEQEHFEKYRLYDVVVYNSNDYLQNLHAATEHYEAGAQPIRYAPLLEPSIKQLTVAYYDLGTAMWHALAGVGHEVAAAVSLQLTLQSLVDGAHVETQSLEEMVALSGVIHGAVEYLSNYLHIAMTYDGRDELSEF